MSNKGSSRFSDSNSLNLVTVEYTSPDGSMYLRFIHAQEVRRFETVWPLLTEHLAEQTDSLPRYPH